MLINKLLFRKLLSVNTKAQGVISEEQFYVYTAFISKKVMGLIDC